MVKITSLSEEEIEQIGEAFAYYDYADGEKGMSFAYDGKESVKEYICGYARAMLKGGCLYSTSENHEAFIAYRYSKDKLSFSSNRELLKSFLKTLGFGGTIKMLKAVRKGGKSYEDDYKKTKKPYIFVGMVVVRKQFQGLGYMRKVLDIAFDEGKRRNCPVLLETDAILKRDKYVHLGMENVRTRRVGEGAVLYDLVKEND